MAYGIAPFPITFSDLHVHSSIARFSYSATIDKISTDTERRAVPLQQLLYYAVGR